MTPPSTGRGIGNILALSTIVTVIIALPVLLNPHTVIFGVETVGRHYDPFVVMQQFAQGGARGIARQPLVDDLGAWLAKGIGPVAAYNVIVLATFPAAAAATYALARFLTGVHRSSLVAALAFAFAPVHVAHAAYHPHIAQVQWIPLYLLALFAALDRPSLRRLAWLAAAVAALVLSNYYGALIGGLITPAAMIAYWCVMPRERRTWWNLAAPSLLLAALGLSTYTVLRIAHPSFLTEAWQPRNPVEALVLYSAKWEAYILPPVDHAVVGPTQPSHLGREGRQRGSPRAAAIAGCWAARLGGRGVVAIRTKSQQPRRQTHCARVRRDRRLGVCALPDARR